jgi:hypothetical protein
MLRPELPKILETYLKLMNQLDNEGVVMALEGIVQVLYIYKELLRRNCTICNRLGELISTSFY